MTSTTVTTIRIAENLDAVKLANRWLLLDAYGKQARFHMAVVWSTVTGFLVVDAIWLSLSRLSFSAGNWESIIRLGLCTAIAFGLCGLIAHRLAYVTDCVGCVLREGAKRVELFANAALAFGLLVAGVITYCCLGAAAALPLQDGRLAQIDKWMGFDWVGFVDFANTSRLASWLLTMAYQSTAYVLSGTLIWFCISGQGKRLAEFLALSCVTSVGIAVGMMVLPAAGAYAFYHPPLASYENFGAGAGMWHYDLLMALRTGSAPVVDFATPNSNCLVTFPSGHTILAVITTYALRGSRWTFVPALAINATMLVSTIPEGGHHLFDLVVGGLIAAGAIWFVRRSFADERCGSAGTGNVEVASA
jgi:membrane-associated phospholipid phosphatase